MPKTRRHKFTVGTFRDPSLNLWPVEPARGRPVTRGDIRTNFRQSGRRAMYAPTRAPRRRRRRSSSGSHLRIFQLCVSFPHRRGSLPVPDRRVPRCHTPGRPAGLAKGSIVRHSHIVSTFFWSRTRAMRFAPTRFFLSLARKSAQFRTCKETRIIYLFFPTEVIDVFHRTCSRVDFDVHWFRDRLVTRKCRASTARRRSLSFVERGSITNNFFFFLSKPSTPV